MKIAVYLVLGVIFGITLAKAEVISWYRIQEMFRFQSFHMYGIIGTAIGLGVIVMYLIKKYSLKNYRGDKIVVNPKEMSIPRYLIGGIIFGLGWALAGACPGPMFINVGLGYGTMFVVIGGALAGTLTYGILKNKLPH